MATIVIGDKLAENLAQQLNLEAVLVEDRVFADGEIKPKLQKEISAETIIFLLQKREQENVNDYLIKYFLLTRKAKDLAKRVIGIMPYLPYARQDAVFNDGEPISSLYLCELLGKNLDVFITCNMHEHRKKIGNLFTIPAYNLSLFSDLAEYFKDLVAENTVVIGPDRESKTFVDDFCKNFSGQKLIMSKQRDTQTGAINFSSLTADLKNKDIIIVDDMVSTGTTIMKVAQLVEQAQAKSINFAFVHSIFGNATIDRLEKIKPRKIVTTNTLDNSKYQLDITKPLAKFLKQEIKL